MSINVTRPMMPPFEEYIKEIEPLWQSRHITNNGIKKKELAKEIGRFLECNNVSLFANGHLSVEYMIWAMGLSGEIITTPFTFASTTHAIVRNGANPVFADIKYSDYTIDPDKIESLITEKTSAILGVHVYGNLCDHDKIQKIADKHGLKVIYDAAHAFGVKKGERSVCDLGDASAFSFHATKVFNTVEGGCVVSKDEDLIKKLDIMQNFGLENGGEDCSVIGGNGKMNEFQAAMGICNLRYVKNEISARKHVFDTYCEYLDGINGIKLPMIDENTDHNYAYYPIVLENFKITRDELAELLQKNGIGARKYFYPLTSSMKCYEGNKTDGLEIANRVAENVITLPLHGDLSEKEVQYICRLISDI